MLPEAPVVELMATVGATVSMVKVFVLLLTLTAKPLVRTVARTAWLSWARAMGWANTKLPPAEVVVVPMAVPSMYTVTIELATTVPQVGVAVLSVLPSAGAVPTGALGVVVKGLTMQ